MTLLNITTQLVGIFCQEHLLSSEGFNAVKVEPQHEDIRKELIMASLDELCTTGIIKRLGEKEVWILTMPPGSQGQEVQMSLPTANWIAETINDFATANKLDMDPVSPLGIHEGHIQTILEILHDLLSEDSEE
jgi:hypothetical protein